MDDGSKIKHATFTVTADQLAFLEREAKRLEVETGGIAVSRSAVVRRCLDAARKRQGEGI